MNISEEAKGLLIDIMNDQEIRTLRVYFAGMG